jgi:acyl-CoA synthetase (AMP-forming)/AMP-acid ligase II
MTPIEFLYRGARCDPDAVAVEFHGETLTHAELIRRVDALAAAFHALDPTPQSRVGVCGFNTPEHLIALLATLAAGKVWVALNPMNGRAELDSFIAATHPSIIVADQDCLDRFTPGEARLVLGRSNGAPGDGDERLHDLIARHDGSGAFHPDLGPDDLIALKFTGGSTGKPKGVMQTVRVWNTVIANQLLCVGFDRTTRHLIASPITHGSGTYVLPTLSQGGRLVLIERARAADVLDAFEKGASGSFLPPTVIYNMLAEPGVAERRYPALKHLIYAGAPMRVDQIRAARRAFGPVLETTFGQTEAPQIISFQRAAEFGDDANLESVGRAAPLNRVEIMDADGRIQPPEAEGEIVVKGDIVMKGYLDLPEETAKTIVDGWLHTGDVGVIDSRGYLFIKGRRREVIISGGFNVYPADVEGALGRHPAVKECVAFGVEDTKWGERVEVAVELHEGAAADAPALTAFVREFLGPIKTPKAIHFTATLPRSAVGKVLRGETKAMIHGRAAR